MITQDTINRLRFACVPSEAILDTPDPLPLWHEILDLIPNEAWLSGQVLDVAAGFGTEAKMIVCEKMVAQGLTFSEAISRITLIEKRAVFVNFLKCLGFTDVRKYDIKDWKETIKDILMTCKISCSNPPYNKRDGIDKQPLYYYFLEMIIECEPEYWVTIVPNGCLVGPNSRWLREKLFNQTGLKRIIMKGPSAFNGQVAQNTVILYGERGFKGNVIFTRSHDNKPKDVIFNRYECIEQVPMVYGEPFHQLWRLIKELTFSVKCFEMKKQLNVGEIAVMVSDGNGFSGYDETTMTLKEASLKAIVPVYIVRQTESGYQYYVDDKWLSEEEAQSLPKKQRPPKMKNFHVIKTLEEAFNVKSWMRDPLFGALFMSVRTTHRTVGANLGQVPIPVVQGVYTREKVLELFGASEQLIKEIDSML